MTLSNPQHCCRDDFVVRLREGPASSITIDMRR